MDKVGPGVKALSPVEDRYVALRLASEPEFILRLDEFVKARGLTEMPALIVQARPVATDSGVGTMLVTDRQARFLKGVPSDNFWWNGFQALQGPAPTFHGIAALRDSFRPTWASEMHGDGHFIAGLWKFPDLPSAQESVPALAEFHGAMFADFLSVVAATVGTQVRYRTTATLVNAPLVAFARQWGGGIGAMSTRLTIQTLQWQIYEADLGTESWTAIGPEMTRALAGAFGLSMAASR